MTACTSTRGALGQRALPASQIQCPPMEQLQKTGSSMRSVAAKQLAMDPAPVRILVQLIDQILHTILRNHDPPEVDRIPDARKHIVYLAEKAGQADTQLGIPGKHAICIGPLIGYSGKLPLVGLSQVQIHLLGFLVNSYNSHLLDSFL